MTRATTQRTITGIAVLSLIMLGATGFASQQNPPAGQAAVQTAAAHQHDHQAKPDEAQAAAMMAKHKEMMAQMQAMDSRLTELVATMKAAKGADKIGAIEAVVGELVAQRSVMRDRMMSMQSATTGHMMEHMQAGGMAGGCPMMSKLAPEAKK